MRFYTNDCIDCGLPCIYRACKYYNVEHFECDECGEEDVKLYVYEGDEICEECLLKKFEIVEGTEIW